MAKTAKLTGDWQKALYMMQNLNKEIESARSQSLKCASLYMERIVKKHIANQDLGWEALQPKYEAWKKKKGYSTLTLVRTSDYANAINAWVEKEGKMKRAVCGVKKDVMDKNGEVIADIASIHEFGFGNNPARPLWGPSLGEAKTDIQRKKKHCNPVTIFENKIKKYI